MKHTTILSIIKSFGFPITIRKMSAQSFVESKATAGDDRAIKCLQAISAARASAQSN